MPGSVRALEVARARLTEAHLGSASWGEWQRAATDYWLLLHPDLARYRRGDPNRTPTIEEFRELAERVMDSSHGKRGLGTSDYSEQEARVGWFHEVLAALYEPVRLAIERVREGDGAGVETLVRFLEADVYCFHSGYMKAEAIRFLVRMPLDPVRIGRLRRVVLDAVEGYDRREFRAYVRLARRVDSDELRASLTPLLEAHDPRKRRHAEWMLAGLGTSAIEGPSGPRSA